MCRPAPFSFSLPLVGGGIEGEGREAEGFSLSEATDGAEAINMIISDRGDEALLHLEPKTTVEAKGLNLSEATVGSLL
jgi:hypothetical protein